MSMTRFSKIRRSTKKTKVLVWTALSMMATLALPNAVLSDTRSLCGENTDDYMSLHQSEISGTWRLDWSRGINVVNDKIALVEELPPSFDVDLSFEDELHLRIAGKVIKRTFFVYWDRETIANFDPPESAPAYEGILDNEEVAVLLGCDIPDVPFLRGASVSSDPKRSTDLYLWMYSSEQMLGMSVAKAGPATSRMMFTLTKMP